jgi:hypothetical protein
MNVGGLAHGGDFIHPGKKFGVLLWLLHFYMFLPCPSSAAGLSPERRKVVFPAPQRFFQRSITWL